MKYPPLTNAEIRALSAMAFGAPASDHWLHHVAEPMVRALEKCIAQGRRPVDPARAGEWVRAGEGK